jgi:hypothetical protein
MSILSSRSAPFDTGYSGQVPQVAGRLDSTGDVLRGQVFAQPLGLVEVHLKTNGIRPGQVTGQGRRMPDRTEDDDHRWGDAVFDGLELFDEGSHSRLTYTT